jgi:hypothetical protein
MPELQDGLMSDDEQVAILAAQYLKQIFQSKGLIPLKVEILLPAHSMDSVRATYRAWLYDHAAHEEGDYAQPTLRWEEGVAHFFREGDHHYFREAERGIWRCKFIPKKDGKWEHNYDAVTDRGQCEVTDPEVDEDAAKEWSRLQLLRPA